MTRARPTGFLLLRRVSTTDGRPPRVVPKPRWCLPPVLSLALLVLSGAAAHAGPGEGGLREESLAVGFMETSFSGVNRADAEAAFKVFSRTVAANRGYEIATKVSTFTSVSELRDAVSSGRVTLVILDSWSYLEIEKEHLVEPVFVPSERGRVAKRHVILTRREGPVRELSDLQGKTLTIYGAPNASLGARWLDGMLEEAYLGRASEFFGATENLSKVSSVVLPVFFGKRDACLVDSTGFALMSEMNPQVGRDLRAVAVSEPLVNAVICVTSFGWSSERFREDLINSLGDLHVEPAGQQILTLFKTERLLAFEDEYLGTLRAMRSGMAAKEARAPSSTGRTALRRAVP